MLTWLRELAATVGTFDRSALEPGYALRCTAGVAIPLVLAALLGHPALGVAAAIGAFITGFTSLQGVYRTRLRAILIAAGGMAVTGFIGALAAHSTAGLVAATLVAGYLCGTIAQLGPAAATVTLNSFVAFVLFSSQALPPMAALEQSGLVLGGGLIQAMLVMIVAPFAQLGAERIALADVYENLAAYARSAAHGLLELPPITPLATARQIIADPQPLAGSAERARLNRLLEDSQEIRASLGALAAGSGVPPGVAEQLQTVAEVLRGKRSAEQVAIRDIPAVPELVVQLRDATSAATVLASGRLPRTNLLSKPRPGPYVESHIAWLSRDSLRYALVLSIAMLLARHFTADRGYWIPLTAAIVLKPDFQTTFVRGFARIGGTLVGAVIATLVLALLRGHPALEIAGILLAAAVAYLTFFPNYAIFTVAITSFVVLVLHMRGLPGTTTIYARVLDTLGGGALAMVGYLAMPTWEHKRTRALLADLLDAQRVSSDAILRAYASPSPQSATEIERARTGAWQARTAAEASLDRTRQEPRRPHSIGSGRALRILAATQRFGLASLALETGLGAPLQSPFRDAIADFADALERRMTEVAEALRTSRRAEHDDPLPPALARMEGALQSETSGQARFIVDRLRTYVDAETGIARLIGAPKKSNVDTPR